MACSDCSQTDLPLHCARCQMPDLNPHAMLFEKCFSKCTASIKSCLQTPGKLRHALTGLCDTCLKPVCTDFQPYSQKHLPCTAEKLQSSHHHGESTDVQARGCSYRLGPTAFYVCDLGDLWGLYRHLKPKSTKFCEPTACFEVQFKLTSSA